MAKLDNERARERRLLANLTQLTTNGIRTAEHRAEFARIEGELAAVRQDIADLERIEEHFRRNPKTPVVPAVAAPAVITETSATERQRMNAAYRSVLRNGLRPERAEQRDLNEGSDADGAALIPQGWDQNWTEQLARLSGLESLVHKFNTGGSFKPIKTVQVNTTETNLAYVPELGSTTTHALQTPSVVSQIQSADNMVLRVTLSWQELDDAFDVLGWLQRSIAPIVSRGLSWALLTGTDPATSTALPNSPTGGLAAFAPTGVTQGALANGITLANLQALRGGLSYAHQFAPKSGFIASESVANYLAQQHTTIGTPLYSRDPKTGLLQIDGSPLYVAQVGSLPAYNAASSNVVAFANFDAAYAYVQTNPKFQVLSINPQQLTSDVIIRLRFSSVGLFDSAIAAFTTAAS